MVKRLAKPWNNPGVPKKKDGLGRTAGAMEGMGVRREELYFAEV